MESEIQKPKHLKYGQMAAILSKPFEIIQTKMSRFWMVWFSNVCNHSYIALPFKNQTASNPIFKKSGFQMFQVFEWSDFRSPLYNVNATQSAFNYQTFITRNDR